MGRWIDKVVTYGEKKLGRDQHEEGKGDSHSP